MIAGALADLLSEGHFASHLRRARKRALQNRDALVLGLKDAPLEIQVPDQGLHLIARLLNGWNEDSAQRLATSAGLSVRRLSSFYLGSSKMDGLVLGFSGFNAEQFIEAGRRYTNMTAWENLQGREVK
jgi:GntR family transcriptional regulator/MocR family aminotransferase